MITIIFKDGHKENLDANDVDKIVINRPFKEPIIYTCNKHNEEDSNG